MCEWYVMCCVCVYACMYVLRGVCVCMRVCVCLCVWCEYVMSVYLCMCICVCACMCGVYVLCVCRYVYVGRAWWLRTVSPHHTVQQASCCRQLNRPKCLPSYYPPERWSPPPASGLVLFCNMGPAPGHSRPPRALFTLLHCHPLHHLPPVWETAAMTLDLSGQPQGQPWPYGKVRLAVNQGGTTWHLKNEVPFSPIQAPILSVPGRSVPSPRFPPTLLLFTDI